MPQLTKKSPVLDNVISLVVNGAYKLIIQSNWTLQYVLHDKLGLTGTKEYGHQQGRGATRCKSCAEI